MSNSNIPDSRMPHPAFAIVFLALVPLLSASMPMALAFISAAVVTVSVVAAAAMFTSAIEEGFDGAAEIGL